MTEPSSPDDALVLSYVDGTLNDGERAAFEARLRAEPALRAEVEGLVAVRALLLDDARHGQSAGLDVPPAHLVDAIVRAEVAARPDAIRAAVLRAADDAAAARPWWSKLSSWLVGGSLVGAGAAALLLVVSRTDEAPAVSPPASQANKAEASAVASPPPPPPGAPAAEVGTAATSPEPPARSNAIAAPASAAPAAPVDGVAADDGRVDGADADEGAADDKAAPMGRLVAAAKRAPAKDALADTAPAVVESARGGDVRASMQGAAALSEALASKADRAGGASSSPAEPTMAPAPAMAMAPPVAEREQRPAIPRSREEFLEKKRAMEAPASKATSAADGPATLRAEVERARRVQAANELLIAAEHELSIGRAPSALEFAQRAEVEDRAGALGALPVATQVRALASLKRNVEAARSASRLLQASPAEPAIVDGLVAGAEAAVAIGDRGLARRLLLRALDPANRDARRRATAQQKLDALGAGEAAKAKAGSSTKPR